MIRKIDQESSTWISMTDLMTVVAIIFLFLSLMMTADLKKANEKYEAVVNTKNQEIKILNKNLHDNFSPEEQKKFKLTDQNPGYATLPENVAYFNVGSYSLRPEFKALLDDFLPKYIGAIYECNHDNVKEIRIEGHTSSEWFAGNVNPDQAYANNMKLSQDRTREILNYALNMPSLAKYKDFLKSKLTANGLSSSHLIYNKDGTENAVASRRIEFRVVTDDSKLIETLEKVQNNG